MTNLNDRTAAVGVATVSLPLKDAEALIRAEIRNVGTLSQAEWVLAYQSGLKARVDEQRRLAAMEGRS